MKYADFLSAFENCGLAKKVLDTTLTNFYYCTKEMARYVDKSFMNDDYKLKYKSLLNTRYHNLFKDADLKLDH